MPWARASEAERWLVCPASTVLPRDERPAGAAAQWGTDVHHWMATGTVPDSGNGWQHLIQQRVDRHPGLRDRLWPPGEGVHELSFAIGPDGYVRHTFRHPDQAVREAWKRAQDPDTVTGTADFTGTLAGLFWADDLKTGKVAPAPTIPQLRVETVLAPPLEPAFTSVTHWHKYPAGEKPVRSFWKWTAEEVEETRHLISRAHSAHTLARHDIQEGREPTANPGDHCRWCPSKNHCLAFQAYDPNQETE